MRGEDVCDAEVIEIEFGSPPHAWGRQNLIRFSISPIRFTPTCVGKTHSPRLRPDNISVHPHMRGEDFRPESFVSFQAGSPPHAWGRLSPGILRLVSSRFTPTCVGKTFWHRRPGPIRPVHPHMRGEDLYLLSGENKVDRFTPTCVGKTPLCASTPSNTIGSPPHAWGRLFILVNYIPLQRFTPTCVGKTVVGRRISLFYAVHPHMRGED